MDNSVAKYLIIGGLLLIVAGVLYYLFSDKLQWFGNLPGDIKMEGENSHFYFPITTMIVISIVLSVLLNLVKRFF